MATLAAERLEPSPPVQPKPIPNGDIAHPESNGQSSRHRLLLSLDAWVRDFPRTIRTFNFRRTKPVRNVGALSGSPQQLQVAAITSAQGSAQRDQTTGAPTVLQSSPAVPSGPAERAQLSQSRAEKPSPAVSVLPISGPPEIPDAENAIDNRPQEQASPPPTDSASTKNASIPALMTLGSITQAGPSSAHKAISPFVKRDKFYESVHLRPEQSLQDQWSTSGRATVDKRLKDLHLGRNAVFNLKLSMMGPYEDEKLMKPTILIVCAEGKVKEVQSGLKEFIRISFPEVEFKVIPGRVHVSPA